MNTIFKPGGEYKSTTGKMDQYDLHEEYDEEKVREAREAEKQIRKIFEKIPNDISLLLFTNPFKNEPFNEATRQTIRLLREMTPKISLREYDLGHEMARKWKAEQSPTLIIDPDKYNIRWLGAPVGEETRTFVQALIMLGTGKTNLGEQAKKILQQIDTPQAHQTVRQPSLPLLPATGGQCPDGRH